MREVVKTRYSDDHILHGNIDTYWYRFVICYPCCSDGNLSESEVELDGEHNEVTLPQDLPGRGNTKSAKSAIR